MNGRAPRRLGYRLGVLTTIGSALALSGISVALWLNPAILRELSVAADLPVAAASADPASPPMQLAARVAAAEATLRSGELLITREYDAQTGSSTLLRFDLGGGQPRLQRITTYYSRRDSQTVEWLTIGDASWQRQPDGGWAQQTPAEQVDIAAQLRALLPQAAAFAGVALPREAGYAVLRWHDAERNAELTLLADPASGVPHELRQTLPDTGEELVISYTSWGGPVDLPAPP